MQKATLPLPRRFLVLCLSLAALGWGGYFLIVQFSPPDPYAQAVFSAAGSAERGQSIFEANCGVCHGLRGEGNIGPSLYHISKHKSTQAIIQQVVSGRTPPMPQFQPQPQEMADLLSYLETL
ncbi:MAG: c-type cytochrome [Cyanobacteriota bacterium]|jgi:mono/diheme cytochrome c family protein